jgi:hypothetical protein
LRRGKGGGGGSGSADVGGGAAGPAVVSRAAPGVREEVVKEVDRPWLSREVAPREVVEFWDSLPGGGRDEVRTVYCERLREWVAVSGDGGTGSGFLWQVLSPRSASGGEG